MSLLEFASGTRRAVPPPVSPSLPLPAPRKMDKSRLEQAAYTVAQIAAQFADAVDREARFPLEALNAMREQHLLAAMVPQEHGGSGASLETIASICQILGRACASAGMVFAMHQIQVSCLVEHSKPGTWHHGFLKRLAQHQWLLASATSEDEVGGNLRKSRCAIEPLLTSFTLHKLAPTISYGAHADAILATARRDPDATSSEQVLVILLREDTTLTRRGSWDTLGMRGTCSEGFVLDARGQLEQVFSVPFAHIAERTMVPVSHILWAALWTGIANDAFQRAHRYFRAQTQNQGGDNGPAGRRIAEALALVQAMQGRVDGVLRLKSQANHERSWSESMAAAAEINTLKTFVSSTALQVVHHAMMICGMAAYKNGTPFSLSRHLRDIYSAPLMINNDRIDSNTANLMLAQRPASPERD